MRYILIILVFLSVGANAQMVIKAHANYRPYASPAVNLLLDDYPNAGAAYSLRKLDKDYAGSAIRVRRSNDNAESDIGFTSGGDLDTATLKTFVGANSGFVVTWYDQSGNTGRNATQSTAANQPRIMNAGVVDRQNGKVGLRWTNNAERLIADLPQNYVHPNTFFSVAKLSASTGINASVLFDSYNSSSHAFYSKGTTETTNNTWSMSSSTNLNGTATDGNLKLFSILFNTTSSQFWVNGASNATGNAGNQGLADLSIGNVRGNPNPIISGYEWSGWIFELILYGERNESSNRTGIESNINSYYSIY